MGPGVAMEIVWPKVKGSKAVQLIQKLTAVYPRRDRRQRRAYNKLVLKAAKLGLLVRVATQPVLEGKPVEKHMGVTGGGNARPNCGHGRPDPAMCPWCNGTNAVPTP